MDVISERVDAAKFIPPADIEPVSVLVRIPKVGRRDKRGGLLAEGGPWDAVVRPLVPVDHPRVLDRSAVGVKSLEMEFHPRERIRLAVDDEDRVAGRKRHLSLRWRHARSPEGDRRRRPDCARIVNAGYFKGVRVEGILGIEDKRAAVGICMNGKSNKLGVRRPDVGS